MNYSWYAIFFLVLAWSAWRPHDYPTWWLEVLPALIALLILLLTRKKFPLTPLAYWLILFHALVLMVGGWRVAAGEMTVGMLATFLTFMTILQMPVRQLGLMVNAYARASTCGARLFLLLDMPVELADKRRHDRVGLDVEFSCFVFREVCQQPLAQPRSERQAILRLPPGGSRADLKMERGD